MPSARERELQKELERVRRALAFYANPKNWNAQAFTVKAVDHEKKTVSVATSGDKYCLGKPAEEDRGRRARKALGWAE